MKGWEEIESWERMRGWGENGRVERGQKENEPSGGKRMRVKREGKTRVLEITRGLKDFKRVGRGEERMRRRVQKE